MYVGYIYIVYSYIWYIVILVLIMVAVDISHGIAPDQFHPLFKDKVFTDSCVSCSLNSRDLYTSAPVSASSPNLLCDDPERLWHSGS